MLKEETALLIWIKDPDAKDEADTLGIFLGFSFLFFENLFLFCLVNFYAIVFSLKLFCGLMENVEQIQIFSPTSVISTVMERKVNVGFWLDC